MIEEFLAERESMLSQAKQDREELNKRFVDGVATMGPQNFSNSAYSTGDFVTVPGADYSPGVISNTSQNVSDYAKASADALPGGFDDNGVWQNTVGDEFIEGALDSVVPMAGSIRYSKEISSLSKTKLADDLWANDPKFKKGITDHVSAQDRSYDTNQRGYIDNISGTVKPNTTNVGMEAIHRGIRLEPGNELEKLKPGDFMTSEVAESFTWDRKIADRFSAPLDGSEKIMPYQMHLVDRQGGIDLVKLTGHNAWGESEVLMPAGAKYEILDIEVVDGVKHFMLGESQTVPKGSRLYTNDGVMHDFTDEESIRLSIEFAESRAEKYKDTVPNIARNYMKTVAKLKRELQESIEAKSAD